MLQTSLDPHPKAIKGNVGHRDLCTEACTALWRLCCEGGFAVAQAAIQQPGARRWTQEVEHEGFQVEIWPETWSKNHEKIWKIAIWKFWSGKLVEKWWLKRAKNEVWAIKHCFQMSSSNQELEWKGKMTWPLKREKWILMDIICCGWIMATLGAKCWFYIFVRFPLVSGRKQSV